MSIKTFNPTTPSRRHLVLVCKAELWKGKPFKALTVGLKKSGGRNNHGRITSRHIGGGHKKRYRIIDFMRTKKMYSQQLKDLNTIQTVQHLLHLSSMMMVK